jgi:hypothetical protein
MFKWIFLVSIQLIHNLEQVQFYLFFFYWPEFLKTLFGPETDKICQFLGPENDHNVNFLG